MKNYADRNNENGRTRRNENAMFSLHVSIEIG